MKRSELFQIFILISTLYDNSKQTGYSGLDDFKSDTVFVTYGSDDYGESNNGTNSGKAEDDDINGIYLLGFGRYMKENYKITFRIYFKPNLIYYLGEEIKFTLIINYLNRLRVLEMEKEEVETVCTQPLDYYDDRIIYDCEAYVTKDKSIKSIISKRDYSYSQSGNVHFIEYSNSINANIAEETEEYLVNPLFTLKDGILIKDGYSFTIEGKIEDKGFSEGYVILILNDIEDRKKIPCNVENFTDEYYDIKCTLNESLIEASLNRAFCLGKNQNLLINMRRINQNMSFVINGTTIIDKKSSSSSKGLSAGAIIGIILPCVVIIIAGLTIGFIYLTSPKVEKHIVKGSSEAFDSGIQMNNE